METTERTVVVHESRVGTSTTVRSAAERGQMDTDLIRKALLIACRAPSFHNTQPWRWVADTTQLHLYLDHSRIVHYTDSSGREALIGCGAILDHLRVATAATGWHTEVDRFPNPNNLERLATLDLTPAPFVTDAERARANAILRRRTDRLPFTAPVNWNSFEPVLRSVLDADVVRLDVLPGQLRPELAETSRLTESLRRYDSDYHAELDWWTAPFELSEGIPRSALASVTEADLVDVNRAFPPSGHGPRRDHIGSDQATVLVLSTGSDSRQDVLACGEMLSTVLLECTMADFATCTVTHVTELPQARDVVRELIGGAGQPQALIRVGRTPQVEDVPPATPRRPVDEFLQILRQPKESHDA
jgi:hypothetical protein